MSYWARKAEDLERRERGNDVIRAWEKRFPPLDILAKIPTGPFKLQAMNSLQRMDKDASKDFFREEIRLNGFSLNREQRLECLRLIPPRIPGDEYGYGFTTHIHSRSRHTTRGGQGPRVATHGCHHSI